MSAASLVLLAALAVAPDLARLERALERARATQAREGAVADAEAGELRRAAAVCGPALAGDVDRALGAASERGEGADSFDRLAGRIEFIRTEAARVAPPAAAARERLRQVLERREFAGRVRPQRPATGAGEKVEPGVGLPAWIERLFERIAGLLERWAGNGAGPRAAPPPGIGAEPLGYALLLAALALLVLVAERWNRERSRRPRVEPGRVGPAAAETAGVEALARTPEDWLAAADERLRAGDLTGAVRALYLSLLVGLHRRGVIEIRPARTNWEHARRVAARLPRESAVFGELTILFDRAVYGRETVTPAAVHSARDLAAALLERSGSESARETA